jgi:sensor histidine kinase regulating citrate/malate metabolism
MAGVYGAAGQRRAPMGYVVVTSLLGAVALIAGAFAVAVANQMILATLIGAMVALWLLATIRHATNGAERRSSDAAP